MAKSRRDFSYQPPSYDETANRAERKGSMFDSMFKDVKVWSPKQGANLIRILPPTWENNRGHYGLYIKLHFNVGPDDRRYLCLKDRWSPYDRCPVDEALYDLGPNASREEKFALRAADRVVYYIIDRDNERDGVQVWLTNPTNDSEIASQSMNRRTKSVLPIADPFDGYDVEFTRSGAGVKNTKYRGFQVMRESSPLSDSDKRMDEWLDFIAEHPLPTILKYYPPEHVEEVFYGRPRDEAKSRRARDQEEEHDHEHEDEPQPLRRTRARDEDEPPTEERSEDESPRRSPRYRRSDDADADADERPLARSRQRDNDEDEPAARPVRRGREERSDDADDDRDEEERRPTRPRSRLARELDDDIPSDAGRRGETNGRANGHDESGGETATRRETRETETDDDDASTRASRRPTRRETASDDDADERPADRPSRSRARVDDDDGHETRRASMRARLAR